MGYGVLMSANQIGPRGFTAFVPNADSRKDTAIYLLAAAEAMDLDPRDVQAASGGFYISDALADGLETYDPDAEDEADESVTEPDEPDEPANPEVDKAVEQLATEQPPVPEPEAAVDAAIEPDVENGTPVPTAPEATEDTEALLADLDQPDEPADFDHPAESAPKRKARKTSSGNRAAKQNSEEE